MPVLQTRHSVPLKTTGRKVRDRPAWRCFCGLGTTCKVPDANTLWDFRGTLAKAARKDTDMRWTAELRKTKAKPDAKKSGSKKLVDIAIPMFGCKPHIGIDREHGIIRGRIVTDAAAHDVARLREGLVGTARAGEGVRADSACRSARNEAWLEERGLKNRIRQRKPCGRSMCEQVAADSRQKSAVRSKVGHVFGHRKCRMGLTVRTIGIARAKAAVAFANMACNMNRLCRLRSRTMFA